MQTIDKKIDCIGSRKTCRYWKKGRKKKNLGTSALENSSFQHCISICFVVQNIMMLYNRWQLYFCTVSRRCTQHQLDSSLQSTPALSVTLC